jgi:hypothetical protein
MSYRRVSLVLFFRKMNRFASCISISLVHGDSSCFNVEVKKLPSVSYFFKHITSSYVFKLYLRKKFVDISQKMSYEVLVFNVTAMHYYHFQKKRISSKVCFTQEPG